MLIFADPHCHPKHGLTQVTRSSQQQPALQMPCRCSGEEVMLLHPLLGLPGMNSPALTPCPQRGALAKSAQHLVGQKKACFRLDPPHNMHLGLKGFSTDSIAISRRPERASVSEALRRTKAASSGLLSHSGNNSFGVRGWSPHTRREEKSTGDKQPRVTLP